MLKIRKTVGCLIFIVVVISFFLVFQTSDQHGERTQLYIPTDLNSAQDSQRTTNHLHHQQDHLHQPQLQQGHQQQQQQQQRQEQQHLPFPKQQQAKTDQGVIEYQGRQQEYQQQGQIIPHLTAAIPKTTQLIPKPTQILPHQTQAIPQTTRIVRQQQKQKSQLIQIRQHNHHHQQQQQQQNHQNKPPQQQQYKQQQQQQNQQPKQVKKQQELQKPHQQGQHQDQQQSEFRTEIPPSKACESIQNIVFVKTHKAGSSTIANILQRFGLAHGLTFALPNKPLNSFGSNYIVRAGQTFSRDRLLPLIKGQKEYNILWCHSIYNKAAYHDIMPNNTLYISILREPFQQFVSSFEYYGVSKSVNKMSINTNQITPNDNPISTFLQSPALSRFWPRQYGYLRNKQAEDLGFGQAEFYQPDKMKSYIQELDTDFISVMIMEYFDESLILLRHKLCWELEDILYIPKNKNKHKPNRTFTDWDITIHKSYSNVDYNLYHHFLQRFKSEINMQPIQFVEEVRYFRQLLKIVADNCPYLKSFIVPESKWNPPFTVTVEHCKLMKISEMEGLMVLRKRYFRLLAS